MTVHDKRHWKLQPAQVAEIRLRRQSGESLMSIARSYGINHCTVHYHCKRQMYQPEPYPKAIVDACEARASGELIAAASHLRRAADLLEAQR